MLESVRSGLTKTSEVVASAGGLFRKASKSGESPKKAEETVQEIVAPEDEQTILSRLNPYGRIDYVLQEGVLENPYLSSLGVHMAYWNDSDCSALLIRALYDLGLRGSRSVASI